MTDRREDHKENICELYLLFINASQLRTCLIPLVVCGYLNTAPFSHPFSVMTRLSLLGLAGSLHSSSGCV
ncbi:hypothetical protein AMEX_G15860 [Astyanax mexicanus]|uniref:Uncharacterized protein n=1 Tax=Astyanax mexicanus TaxID=7994 RepID=A0A8T2LJ23_ASTMX|nr:hypothetical protein AMEX_G15860 [Astyanax mexicanus]